MNKLFLYVCFVLAAFLHSSYAVNKYDSLIRYKDMKPKGKYYNAQVPDTLDLAERAALGVKGLTNFLDPNLNYQHYAYGIFTCNPPYMSHEGDGGANWGKTSEALILARHMSGSTENLDIHVKMLQGMLRNIRDNGNYYVVLRGIPLEHCQDLIANDSSRVIISLLGLYQLNHDPKLAALINKIGNGLFDLVTYENNCAYFTDDPEEPHDTMIGVLGFWKVAFIHGTSVRGLSRLYNFNHDTKFLNLAEKVKNYVHKPEYWKPESAPKAVVGSEHGQFEGHHHSYSAALYRLLWYAQITNDPQLKNFVREGYEYLRNFGLSRIGMYGEMCTTGDMTNLALKLTEFGVGDYWEDVDCYVRNQLVELQITDVNKLQKAVEQMPKLDKVKYIHEWDFRDVYNRNLGVYLSDASNPTLVRQKVFRWTVCCVGNCFPAMYGAWESIVRCDDNGVATINLLLNRASKWLDIDSYLPYEGKVVIKNKTAKKLFVRIPLYADKDAVKTFVNDKAVEFNWLNRYIIIDGINKKDIITITFPLKETVEKYTLKWKPEDFWPESTNPGNNWVPGNAEYTMIFKANTLIDISPRCDLPGYPIYQRDYLKADKAPIKKITRFVPDLEIKQ